MLYKLLPFLWACIVELCIFQSPLVSTSFFPDVYSDTGDTVDMASGSQWIVHYRHVAEMLQSGVACLIWTDRQIGWSNKQNHYLTKPTQSWVAKQQPLLILWFTCVMCLIIISISLIIQNECMLLYSNLLSSLVHEHSIIYHISKILVGLTLSLPSHYILLMSDMLLQTAMLPSVW